MSGQTISQIFAHLSVLSAFEIKRLTGIVLVSTASPDNHCSIANEKEN